MSRWEFMRRLEELLFDIAPAEREEALQYYNDYFNDAGKENEQEVIKALGTPEQVAKIVKDGLGDNISQGEYTEKGFQNSEVGMNAIIKHTEQSNRFEQTSDDMNAGGGQKGQDGEKGGLPTWAIVLLVIAVVICSPALIGAAFSVLGVIFGIVCAVFGIVIGLGAATIALYMAAIALLVTGFGMLLSSPLVALGLIGGALICAAIGILFMILEVLLVGKCIPAIFQGISYIFQKLFGKKGGAKA